jgi:type II secretory pathway predicted ATPase ExeA
MALQTATLGCMVRDTGGLHRNPFDGSLAAGDFFVGPAQEEPLARLEWLVDEQQRLGLVVAPSGCGKSHLAAKAVRRFGALGAEATLLSLRGLREGDWLDLLLDRLPLDPLTAAEPLRPWQKLENRLRENTLMERPTAIVFDDLHEATPDALAGVERLVSSAEPRFSRLLVVGTVADSAVGQLPVGILGRTAVRVELAPWSEAEAASFLAWAVARTGRPADLFSGSAAATLTRLASGVPRTICQLARLAIVAADAGGLQQLDPLTVERVWRELMPASAAPPAAHHAAASEEAPANPRVRAVRRLSG